MFKLAMFRWRNRWIRHRLQGRDIAPVARENLSALDHLDLAQNARDLRYVILDLETTGLSLNHDKVVSLSATRVVDGRIQLGDSFNTLVNPERTIPVPAIKVHGIMPSMIARAPSLDEIMDKFLQYLGSDILVGYHARFDLSFLNSCMKRKYGFRLQNLVLDVMFMFRNIIIPAQIKNCAYRSKREQCLDETAKHLDIEIPDRHTASGDAMATAMMFQRILAELEKNGPAKLRNLISAARDH